ncbi:hypothetical protein ACQKEK_00760 [Pseudomonas sp. NPDC077408]
MTQQTVEIEFSYYVGDVQKTGNISVRPKVADAESEEGWRLMVERQVLRTIGEIEPELIVKTGNSWFGNTKGYKEPETELIGPLDLVIKQFPEVSPNTPDYTLNRRLDTPRRFDLP